MSIHTIENILENVSIAVNADGESIYYNGMTSSLAWSSAGGFIHTQRALDQINTRLNDPNLTEDRRARLEEIIRDMETRCEDYLNVYAWARSQTSMDVSGATIVERFSEASARPIEIPEDHDDKLAMVADILDMDIDTMHIIDKRAQANAKSQAKIDAEDSAKWVRVMNTALILNLDASTHKSREFEINDRYTLSLLNKMDFKIHEYIIKAVETFLNYDRKHSMANVVAAMQNLPHLKATQKLLATQIQKVSREVESTQDKVGAAGSPQLS